MRYCPVPSLVAERTFSIRAGLEASTITPGSTAPESSRTTPASDACASARVGSRTSSAAASPSRAATYRAEVAVNADGGSNPLDIECSFPRRGCKSFRRSVVTGGDGRPLLQIPQQRHGRFADLAIAQRRLQRRPLRVVPGAQVGTML